MNFYHRPHRLLLDAQPGGAPPRDGGGSHNGYGGRANFDTNMVIILACLLCVLICALGINSVVRFIMRCARRVGSETTDQTLPRLVGKGVKKVVLRRIPVAVYGSENGVAFTDCAICLAEFLDGEKIRVLPICHHCFHVRCVDIWLASHPTCPTCRQLVVEEQADSGGGEVAGNATGNGSAEEVG